jgi:hypothetical protein
MKHSILSDLCTRKINVILNTSMRKMMFVALGGIVVSVFAIGPKVRGFNPG